MERQAEKWYFELRESRYKYVAMQDLYVYYFYFLSMLLY